MRFFILGRTASFLATAVLTLTTSLGPMTSPATAQVQPATETETAARNERVVRAAFDRWAAGGSVFDILAADMTWTIHGSGPVADTYRGVEDFLGRGAEPLTRRLATPLVPRVHDIWVAGDTAIIRFDASAVTTSGRPYENRFLWIFRMRNGVVVEAEAFLDLVAYQAVIDGNAPRQD